MKRAAARRSAIRIARRTAVMPLLAAVLLLAACGSIARPQGWAAPALKDDTLYVSLDHGKLSAYKLSAGAAPQALWEFPRDDERLPLVVAGGKDLGVAKSASINFEGLYGDPAVADDTVYLTAYSGHVIAVNKADGRARWVAELPGRMIGGVLVQGDNVYAGTTKGELYALDRASGHVRWRHTVGNEVWSTPVAVEDRVVIAAMDGSVTAFDAGGARQWRTALADSGIAATPRLDGGRLYVGSFDKRMYALDARTGQRLWRSATVDSWFWTEATVADNTVFAGSLGGSAYAYDANSSGDAVQPKWAAKVGTMVRSSPVVAGGVLVVGTKDGRLIGLQPGDGKQVWDVPKAPAADDPAAPRGDLYADLLSERSSVYASTESGRSNGVIYVLDTGTQKVSELRLK